MLWFRELVRQRCQEKARGPGVSLSRGVWLRSIEVGPRLLVTEFARFGENNQPAPSKPVGKNALLTKGFLGLPDVLKAVLPPLQWLYSDKLETGAAVFWALGTVPPDGNASVWVQDPKERAFSGEGVQVDFDVHILFPRQNTLAFGYGHKKPAGSSSALWAPGWKGEHLVMALRSWKCIGMLKNLGLFPGWPGAS